MLIAPHFDGEVNLLRMFQPLGDHIGYEEMVDFLCGNSSNLRSKEVENHLTSCQLCATELEEMAAETEISLSKPLRKLLRRIPGLEKIKMDPIQLAIVAYDEDMPVYTRARAKSYLALHHNDATKMVINELDSLIH